jgi:hypothetical protein
MARQNSTDEQCEALFASAVQRSDGSLSGEEVADAINQTVRQFGVGGCASRMAQEYGDHPEAAMDRMRWVRQLVDGLSALSSAPAGRALRCAA